MHVINAFELSLRLSSDRHRPHILGWMASTSTQLMLRQRNSTARAIIRALLAEGPLGRKELATSTGASFTTITKLVSELLERGDLEECPQTRPRHSAGRPTIPIDVPRQGRLLLGAHLHPAHTSCGVYTLRGEQVLYRSLATSARTSQERINEVTRLIGGVVDEFDTNTVVGIGVSKPWDEFWAGPRPQQVVDVDHADLLDSLRARIDLPIRVDSNVQALALDQHWWDGYDGNVLSILVGRSMRIAQMQGDRLILEGPTGGGVVSHLVVPGSSAPCNCGQVGCVRVTCTDDALLTQAIEAGLLPTDASQHHLYPAEDGMWDTSARPPGHPSGLQTLRRDRARALGMVIPLLISLLQPDQTVISGPLGTQEEIDECLDMVRRRHTELTGRAPQVHRHARFGPETWPRASAALALDGYLAAPLGLEQDTENDAIATTERLAGRE
ncbi:ROK family transcriptional regulator [Ruania halotolerans]|uniref:ROK family transcriptional regulator n=1 Tax=Ruania halotolerans TaxID=2897773 RepID=UPI001E3D65A5|nr:ROK family protein [Ruania halotolerans]UFU06814.1 ROK family protein [Ruania halotolerans]